MVPFFIYSIPWAEVPGLAFTPIFFFFSKIISRVKKEFRIQFIFILINFGISKFYISLRFRKESFEIRENCSESSIHDLKNV